MSLKDEFYEKIDLEHDEFRKRLEGLSTDEIIDKLWELARFQTIYNYIKKWEPLEEFHYEQLLKVDRPIETICSVHKRMPSEIHDDYMYAIVMVTDYELLSPSDIETRYDEELYESLQMW